MVSVKYTRPHPATYSKAILELLDEQRKNGVQVFEPVEEEV